VANSPLGRKTRGIKEDLRGLAQRAGHFTQRGRIDCKKRIGGAQVESNNELRRGGGR